MCNLATFEHYPSPGWKCQLASFYCVCLGNVYVRAGLYNQLSFLGRFPSFSRILRIWYDPFKIFMALHECWFLTLFANLFRFLPWVCLSNFMLVRKIRSSKKVRSRARYLTHCMSLNCRILFRLAVFYLTSVLVGGFSGVLAFGLMQMDGIRGYRGWRWIFVSLQSCD